MAFKILLSGFLWVALIASPTLASAKVSQSSTISISIIVPERAKDQKCVVSFEDSFNKQSISIQSSGCQYDSKKLLQTAYKQAMKHVRKNSQGFITVLITAP